MPKNSNKKTAKKIQLSIVIPAKDEERNLKMLLPRVTKAVKKLGEIKPNQVEIIVVCDSCTDNSQKVAKLHKLKVIKRTENPGKSKALIEGFKKSKGDILVMMDADLSHLPEDLPKMIKKLMSEKNIGLVIASRTTGGSDDATRLREFGGKTFNIFTNLFFGTNLTDAINGYKIFKREVFDNFNYTAKGYAIEIELVANTLRAGMQVEEIPSFEAAREHGYAKSKIIKDGWIFLREIFVEGINYQIEKLASNIKNST